MTSEELITELIDATQEFLIAREHYGAADEEARFEAARSALQAELNRLKMALQEILDLARTSLAPDALNIGQQAWGNYRVIKIARMAREALEGGE